MADVVAAVDQFIGNLLPILWEAVARRVDVLKNLEDHIDNLKIKMDELKNKRTDIEGEVKQAEGRQLDIKNEVKNWIQNVNWREKEVNGILSEFEQRRSCFRLKGGRLDCFSRYKLSKEAVKCAGHVADLMQTSNNLGEIAKERPPKKVEEMPTHSRFGQATYEETLWKYLYDEEMHIVSVYGMGGIGKTNLLKAINNKLAAAQEFDMVIWVNVSEDQLTVSKERHTKRIQMEIGGRLKLGFKKVESNEERRQQIWARLANTRYVIILDELWNNISLDDVGIPKPDRQNRCKILLSTRLMTVSNGMDANKHIEIKTLEYHEAWELFCAISRTKVFPTRIESLAKDVVKECGGLPLAIVTVAKAMRGKEEKEWWLNALRALKESDVKEVHGMETDTFQCLKRSYDYLEDDDMKLCFLYCALYPEDYIDVDNLARYLTMEGIIQITGTLEDASNKGHAIILKLKDACLLEDGGKFLEKSGVKMHDLHRDLAIWITSKSSRNLPSFENKPEGIIQNTSTLADASNKGHANIEKPKDAYQLEDNKKFSEIIRIKRHDWNRDLTIRIRTKSSRNLRSFENEPILLVKAGMGLEDPPVEKFWEGVDRISLIGNNIKELSAPPNCPRLLSLRLESNPLKSIHANFFDRMPLLRVLDLSRTDVESLPASLSSLLNLNSLILHNCSRLKQMPSLGGLQPLQFLDLENCRSLEELPQGIGELLNLKWLNLSDMKIRTIPSHTISRLSRLEVLYMQHTPIKRAEEGEQETAIGDLTASLEEIAKPKRLNVLSIHIGHTDCLASDIFNERLWSRLRRFSIVFGDSDDKEAEVSFNFDKEVLFYDSNFLHDRNKVIVKHAEFVKIKHCPDQLPICQTVCDSKSARKVVISKCPDLEYIIDLREVGSNIEELDLYELNNLKKLFHGQVPNDSQRLQRLRELHISYAPELRCLFSSDLVKHLNSLEKLELQECGVEEIIKDGDNMQLPPESALPRLRHLALYRLERLKSICTQPLTFASLEEIAVQRCPKLKKLPSCPRIRKLKGEEGWFRQLDYDDESPIASAFAQGFDDAN